VDKEPQLNILVELHLVTVLEEEPMFESDVYLETLLIGDLSDDKDARAGEEPRVVKYVVLLFLEMPSENLLVCNFTF